MDRPAQFELLKRFTYFHEFAFYFGSNEMLFAGEARI